MTWAVRTLKEAYNWTAGRTIATKRMKSNDVEEKKTAEHVASTAEDTPKYPLASPVACPVTSVGNIRIETTVAVAVTQAMPT